MAKHRPDSRYEVMAKRDGRWTIDCLRHDEADARSRAETLYNDDTVEAVRIMRGHFGGNGSSYETPILERTRDKPRGAPPMRVAASPRETTWCETLDELYTPASRRAIGRLLRSFLDTYCLTPTELLHQHRHMRLLDKQGDLLPQALQRVAALQARERGADARARVTTLDNLMRAATDRARKASEPGFLPVLGADGLPALADAIAARFDARCDQAFHLRVAAGAALGDAGSSMAKFERVIAWAGEVPAPRLRPLIDEMISGLLESAALLQELLGPRAHLAAALLALAELCNGKCDRTPESPPVSRLAQLIGEGELPETRLMLLERLQREIAGDKALSRELPGEERRCFDRIAEALLDRHGMFAGGGAMVDALARRSRRLGIVGGIEPVRFASSDPLDRVDQLLALDKTVLGERQQQAMATYLMEIIEAVDATSPRLDALRSRIAAMQLPERAKAAALARFPHEAARMSAAR